MSYYYDSDDDIDVRVRRHRERSPSPVHYVETIRSQPRGYFKIGPRDPERTVVTTRSRSRERSPSPPAASLPIIINSGYESDHDDDVYKQQVDRQAGRLNGTVEKATSSAANKPTIGSYNAPRVTRVHFDDDLQRTISSQGPGLGSFQTILDADHQTDVTVHLKLPVIEDLDDELEEFSRLKRLGDFGSARDFFEKHLEGHQDHPYIFVQYAEMLLDMGDYGSFEALDPTAVFNMSNKGHIQKFRRRYSRHEGDGHESGPEAVDLLRVNWELLEAVHGIYRKGRIANDALITFNSILSHLNLSSDIGSTEIQILRLIMRVLGVASQWRMTAAHPKFLRWEEIYAALLAEGRIWDFKDLFDASLSWTSSIGETMTRFYGTGVYTRRLIDDWVNDDGTMDESTNLALLEIYVSVLLKYYPGEDDEVDVSLCLKDAQFLAESLAQNYPNCTRSRTFAQWIVVKTAEPSLRGSLDRARWRGALFDALGGFFGRVVAWGRACKVPVYVPATVENPLWQLPEGPPESKELLTMSLKLAAQLQDYKTQQLCLLELIVNSRDPAKYWEEVSHLQKSVKDRCFFLWSCLSRYLVCTDRESQMRLLDDLNSFPDWVDPLTSFDPESYWARDLIRGALSEKLGEGPLWPGIGKSFRVYKGFLSTDQFVFMRQRLREAGEYYPSYARMHRGYYGATGRDRGPSHAPPPPPMPREQAGKENTEVRLAVTKAEQDAKLGGERDRPIVRQSLQLPPADATTENVEEVHRAPSRDGEKKDSEEGKTYNPSVLARERVLKELGYPYTESGKHFVVDRAPGPEEIEKIIKEISDSDEEESQRRLSSRPTDVPFGSSKVPWRPPAPSTRPCWDLVRYAGRDVIASHVSKSTRPETEPQTGLRRGDGVATTAGLQRLQDQQGAVGSSKLPESWPAVGVDRSGQDSKEHLAPQSGGVSDDSAKPAQPAPDTLASNTSRRQDPTLAGRNQSISSPPRPTQTTRSRRSAMERGESSRTPPQPSTNDENIVGVTDGKAANTELGPTQQLEPEQKISRKATITDVPEEDEREANRPEDESIIMEAQSEF